MNQRWGQALLVAVLCASAVAVASVGHAQPASPGGDDFRVWAAISGSGQPSDFEAFLRIYPNSLLAPLAAGRLAALRRGGRGEASGQPDRSNGPRLYRYRNSSLPAEPTGVPISLHRMHLRLDAPTDAKPASMPINDEKLMTMCSDENGCLVTLSMVGWVDRGIAIEAPNASSDCRFYVRLKNGQRHWQVASTCFQWYGVHGADEKGNVKWDDTKPGRYIPYWSNYNGIDGLDRVPAAGGDRSYVLYLGSCVFSESPPDPESKGRSERLPDTQPGFYLIAGTAAWAGDNYPTAGWPPEARGRACELTIED